MRIGYILLGIALHVAISSTPSVVEAESVQITEGSIPYQNVEMVIQFLRDHGDDTVADEIQTLLSKGKLYVDSDLAENAETSALNNITLSSTMAAHTLPFNRDRPFDPVKDFQSILELARTLYHENIHANHQSYAYWLYSMPAPGEPRESDAWSKTISAMDGWLHVEQERLDPFYRPKSTDMTAAEHRQELERIETKIGVMKKYLGDYKDNDYFGRSDADDVEFSLKYLENELERLEPRLAEHQATSEASTDPPSDSATAVGEIVPAAPSGRAPASEAESESEPKSDEPGPKTDESCPPCDPIVKRIEAEKTALQKQVVALRALEADLSELEAVLKKLRVRERSLRRLLQRSSGTGGSSYDPSTGITVEAWDQGDGTVKITTRDRDGNVVEERSRDANRHKAELRDRLDRVQADIKREEARAKKQRADIAAAEGDIAKTVARLAQLAADLVDCIQRLCRGGATSTGAVGTGGLLIDPLTSPDLLNPEGVVNGARNTNVQLMIIEMPTIELRARTGAATPPLWLTERFVRARSESGPPMVFGQSPGAAAASAFIQSLGVSTGEAFDLRLFRDGDNTATIHGGAVVVEPVERRVRERLETELERRDGETPATSRVNGYCLEYLREPPAAGMMFRLASRDLQTKFEPMRRILDASRALREVGGLNPDSDPDQYFHSVRQWAIWSHERGFDQDRFEEAFVERTKKNLAAAGQSWSGEIESAVRGLAPNRWNDISAVLARAISPSRD